MPTDVTTTAPHRTRTSGPFVTPRQRTRYIVLVSVLVALALLFTVLHMTYGNPVGFGEKGFWRIVVRRRDALIAIALVALCQAFATVAFHTATNNRIITPSIMGF
ncbi:MAG: iron chelate uptake ABC transporter family permease subunit, partial [Corynebacterium variabile]